MLPPKSINTLALLSPVFVWLVSGSFLLGLSLTGLVFVWRRAGKAYLLLWKIRNHADNSVFTSLGFSTLAVLFFSITNNHGGAFGEFFFQTQWTPTGACADRRALCENMSFGVNSLLLTTAGGLRRPVHCRARRGVRHLPQRVRFASFGGRGQTNPRVVGRCSLRRVRLFCLHLHRSAGGGSRRLRLCAGWIDAPPSVLNPINGAIVVGVMILPLVASMSEDAREPFPTNCEKAHSLGATKSKPRSA